jgi:hypothetical protein
MKARLYKISKEFEIFLESYLSSEGTDAQIRDYLDSEDCILADSDWENLNVVEIKKNFKWWLSKKQLTNYKVLVYRLSTDNLVEEGFLKKDLDPEKSNRLYFNIGDFQFQVIIPEEKSLESQIIEQYDLTSKNS